MVPEELIRDVALLCLDAGNTIVFLDHDAAAAIAQRHGFPIDPVSLQRAEGEAKRRLERSANDRAPPLPDPDVPPSWSSLVRTMVQLAGGLDLEASAVCTRVLWEEHRTFNLWRRVPDGLIEAVTALRHSGVPVCVVSNSEGKLHELFERLGIDKAFDLVIDSHVLGIEKPDPRIFQHALARFGVSPSSALHLGDVVAIDIVGARAAGMRAALIDPYGHYEGTHPDVPRVPGAAAVARAIVALRQ